MLGPQAHSQPGAEAGLGPGAQPVALHQPPQLPEAARGGSGLPGAAYEAVTRSMLSFGW